MPLVYSSARASKQAADLMPGVVLERVVADAILRGDVVDGRGGGIVFLRDLGVVVRAERRPGRIRQRPRAWVVVGVEPEREPVKRRRGVCGGQSDREKVPPAAVETPFHKPVKLRRASSGRGPSSKEGPPAAAETLFPQREEPETQHRGAGPKARPASDPQRRKDGTDG